MAKGEDFLGGGLAKGAADTLKLRQQYNAYRENAISSGEQGMAAMTKVFT